MSKRKYDWSSQIISGGIKYSIELCRYQKVLWNMGIF
nr:MAG TPA: hypothetical protein [Caudoviricetes sp.]